MTELTDLVGCIPCTINGIGLGCLKLKVRITHPTIMGLKPKTGIQAVGQVAPKALPDIACCRYPKKRQGTRFAPTLTYESAL
jgi:hypothetical protein